MDKRKIKKLLILNLPYFLVGLFATNLGEAWRLAEGADSSAKILSFFNALPIALNNPLPSFHPLDLLIGIFCGAGLRLAVYLKGKNAKKYRHNVEYGSARWGTAKDIEPFIAPKFEDNVILTKTERLMMSNRPKNPANARNKNVLIIGGSGSGKTRFWLKPNLLQMHSSYVVTDPKGSIVIECGNALLKHGYNIKIFNTINFRKSMHYNPFAYIHSEKDILKLVTTLIANTKGDGKAGDEFWTKAETLLYCALIGYIHYEAPVEEQNFSTLIEFLNAMEVREDDEEFQNPVDLMFEALEKKKPNHFAVRQYKKYKLAAGKTAKSILISCGARLAPFDIQEVRDVTAYDELQLDTLGDKKTALFLIMSDTDATFNFLISMIYTQLFNLLCEKADDVYGGRLPVHVRCLIDEMANKSFAKYISEFNDIPEHLKDKRIDEIDRTPAENLAYQVGWTTLVIKWESDERKGIPVKTPSDNFKWNQLGELYQWFTDTYAQLSLQELKDRLNENINSIYAMIDSLSDEELFKPHMRKWADEATKTAVWEVYKFIHVNTVAPFGTFRTKIRKWKKIAL